MKIERIYSERFHTSFLVETKTIKNKKEFSSFKKGRAILIPNNKNLPFPLTFVLLQDHWELDEVSSKKIKRF